MTAFFWLLIASFVLDVFGVLHGSPALWCGAFFCACGALASLFLEVERE